MVFSIWKRQSLLVPLQAVLAVNLLLTLHFVEAQMYQLDILRKSEDELLRSGFVEDHEDEIESILEEPFEVDRSIAPNLHGSLVVEGGSAVHVAIVAGKERITKQIIDAALKSRKSAKADTWLQRQLVIVSGRYHIAAVLCRARPSMLQLLVRHGRHGISVRDGMRQTLDALMAASETGQIESAKTLVELGAPLAMVNRSHLLTDIHPIHAAAINNHTELVRYFVKEAGVDVDTRSMTGHGDTVLHVAAHRGLLHLAKVAIEELGADYTLANRKDEATAYSLAQQWHHHDLAKYLESVYARHGKPLPSLPSKDTLLHDSKNLDHHISMAKTAGEGDVASSDVASSDVDAAPGAADIRNVMTLDKVMAAMAASHGSDNNNNINNNNNNNNNGDGDGDVINNENMNGDKEKGTAAQASADGVVEELPNDNAAIVRGVQYNAPASNDQQISKDEL